MRIIFAGTPSVAVPALDALADAPDIDVVAVLTRADAPSGRGRKLKSSEVKVRAQELGIPVYEDNPNSEQWLHTLAELNVDAAAVVAYGKILKQSVLDALPLGWYNLHFSLLPTLRGAAPAQRAIWQGMTQTGATVFRIQAGMDDGPIVAQAPTEINSQETAGELLERMAREQASLLVAALQSVAQGSAQLRKQSEEGVSYAAKITHEDAHLDVAQSCQALVNQIRACAPAPGAWVHLFNDQVATAEPDGSAAFAKQDQGLLLRILRAQCVESTQTQDIAARVFGAETLDALALGRIGADKKHVWLRCADGLLELSEVQAQGKKVMRAADWARGAHLSAEARVQ